MRMQIRMRIRIPLKLKSVSVLPCRQDSSGNEEHEAVARLTELLDPANGFIPKRPCRTLMLTTKPLLSDFDAAVVHGSDIIRWISRDSSKPGRHAAPNAGAEGGQPDMDSWCVNGE